MLSLLALRREFGDILYRGHISYVGVVFPYSLLETSKSLYVSTVDQGKGLLN